jgi:hypothetical protein
MPNLLRTFSVALAATALVSLSAKDANAAPSGNLKYYGGHVISNVEVVPVMWGSSVSSDVVGGAQKFYGDLVASPYIDWLGEYDTVGLMGAADQKAGSNQRIHRGTAQAAVTIKPSITSKSITDAQIQKELLAQLASGALPAPHVAADGSVDTVYMFSFAAGVAVSDFGGQDVCSGACAYHWTVSVPGIAAGVPYGVLPDCSGSKTNYCSLGKVFDTFTGDASHELVEAITDPECGLVTTQAASRPLGWFDPNAANEEGEVADICLSDPNAFTSYLGYTVQANWSQRLGKCITNDPSIPLCDGATHPCRPCGASDCSGASPMCDLDPTSTTLGQCIAAGSANHGTGDGTSGGDGSNGGSGSAGGSNGGGNGNGSVSGGSGASSGDGTTGSGESEPPQNQGGCDLSARSDASSGAFVAFALALATSLFARRRRSVE